jgi:hypothetical protein
MRAPEARLVEGPALLARKPEAFLEHPCPQGLAAYLDVMLGEQDFGSQRRAEVRILGLNQIEHVPTDAIAQAVVRRLTSTLVDQPAATIRT